jgi:hypothetical protein
MKLNYPQIDLTAPAATDTVRRAEARQMQKEYEQPSTRCFCAQIAVSLHMSMCAQGPKLKSWQTIHAYTGRMQ